MDPIAALGLASTAIEIFIKYEPVAAKLITNFKPVAIALFEKFTGKPITDNQRSVLEERIDDMHFNFQRPIPPVSDQ